MNSIKSRYIMRTDPPTEWLRTLHRHDGNRWFKLSVSFDEGCREGFGGGTHSTLSMRLFRPETDNRAAYLEKRAYRASVRLLGDLGPRREFREGNYMAEAANYILCGQQIPAHLRDAMLPSERGGAQVLADSAIATFKNRRWELLTG